MYKVLIVDDESAIRKGLASCIGWTAIGCEVINCASNGKQALEVIEKSQPDIVISDIHMEEMSGIDILKVASEEYPNIKFILLTGIYEFNNAL
jgi:two-component system response regulator YesN